MTKSAGPGICTHCLNEVSERNWDHVLPESWYPKSTPPDMEKWKVPSCLACNSEYGKIEQDLLIKFGLCLDPNHPDTKDVVERALRSINGKYGKNPLDQKRRDQKKQKILKDAGQFAKIPDHGVYPNFGPVHPPSPEGYIGIFLPKSHLEKVAEKIVRGITQVTDGSLIDSQYDLDIYVLDDESASSIIQMIDRYGEQLHRGSALLVRRAVIPEDRRSGFYAIEIWGRFKIYASVTPKGLVDAL